jgi:hypothetical protein
MRGESTFRHLEEPGERRAQRWWDTKAFLRVLQCNCSPFGDTVQASIIAKIKNGRMHEARRDCRAPVVKKLNNMAVGLRKMIVLALQRERVLLDCTKTRGSSVCVHQNLRG